MNLRETIRKVLREDKSHSEEVLSKMINKLILKKGDYPWAQGVYSVQLTEETEHHGELSKETWGSRILIEIKPEYFVGLSKNWSNFANGEKVWIYYGSEISRRFISKKYDKQPYELSQEIENLSQKIGFEPHYSLFNVYYVILPTEEELNNKPVYI